MSRLYEKFEETLRANRASAALVDSAGSLTYTELRKATSMLALEVSRLPSGPIVIRTSRNRSSVVAILAVLQAGRPYIPIDRTYPASRIDLAARESAAAAVVEASSPGRPTITEVAHGSGGRNALFPDLAYVIYTSGSSGDPKGVMVSNENVTSMLAATTPHLSAKSGDRHSLLHSFAFDFSVWELWSAWSTEGTVVLADERQVRNPRALTAFIASAGVAHLSATPSLFTFLSREMIRTGARAAKRLTTVVLGGEAVRLQDVLRLKSTDEYGDVRALNMYGITETTVHASCIELKGDEALGPSASTPIGTPLDHLKFSIRDGHGNPMAPGEVGEVWLAGPGVSWGYLGRPSLTLDRFPTTADGTQWYRSGDLALRNEHQYFYVGRADRQVKVRGFRIELGEIEACLEKQPGVRRAHVIVERRGRETALLAAYVEFADGHEFSPSTVRNALRQQLPDHMIPGDIVKVDGFEMTSNGKLVQPSRISDTFENGGGARR